MILSSLLSKISHHDLAPGSPPSAPAASTSRKCRPSTHRCWPFCKRSVLLPVLPFTRSVVSRPASPSPRHKRLRHLHGDMPRPHAQGVYQPGLACMLAYDEYAIALLFTVESERVMVRSKALTCLLESCRIRHPLQMLACTCSFHCILELVSYRQQAKHPFGWSSSANQACISHYTHQDHVMLTAMLWIGAAGIPQQPQPDCR